MSVSGQPIDLTGDYLKSDGKPVAETEIHRDNLLHTIESLRWHFEADPDLYVSGNMFVHYVRGDRRKHVAPDVFAVRGVPKGPPRDYYLVWEEAQPPHLVIEFTSRTTRDEDQEEKFAIYRDRIKVREYYLFDPREEYLEPSLQGYRLDGEQYVPIEPVDGRLPSEVLGLHLFRDGQRLRFLDPATGAVVPLPRELIEQTQALARQAEDERRRIETERQQEARVRQQVEAERQCEAEARRQVEAERDRMLAEIDRLRQQLDTLRQQAPPGNGS
jgi:Uma2 family endonuclease